MAARRVRGHYRVLTAFVVWLMVAGSASAVQQGVAGAGVVEDELPEGFDELLADRAAGGSEALEWDPFEEPVLGEVVESEGVEPLAATELPEPAVWPDGGEGGPVEVSPTGESAQLTGDELQVEVLDPAVADDVGVSAFLFKLSGGDGATDSFGEGGGSELPVELTVDYSGFAGLYGGGFVDRLQVVALPACAFGAEVDPAACDVSGLALPTEVDHATATLRVEVEDLADLAVNGVDTGRSEEDEVSGEGSVVFGVTSGVSGDSGTYAASSLGVTGDWVAGAGSGEFSYGYDMDVPAPAGGGAPDVGLSYSSGVVDGLTNATNPQPSGTGLGWSDFDGAFIERSYQPCVNTDSWASNALDLCWLNQNGTLSLGEASGTLLPLDEAGTEWAVHSDAGWKVERLTGADNGAHEGEYWKVTSTDGTEYFFGLGQNPDTGKTTSSALTAPVLAPHQDDPCWDESALHLCENKAWRWSLDRVVDPDGNVTSYHYLKTRNRYAALNGMFGGETLYDREHTLTRIEYGGRVGENVEPAGRVTFGRQYRCNTLNAACADNPPRSTSGWLYPDAPTDLICSKPADTPCQENAPSFFSVWRYTHVRTEVRVGSEWRPVTQYNLNHAFKYPEAGQPHKLYLNSVQQHGVSQGDWLLYEPTKFTYTWLPNRADVDQSDVAKTSPHGRVNSVTNPFGGVTLVGYGQNRPCAQDWRPRRWHENDRDCSRRQRTPTVSAGWVCTTSIL